MVAEVEVISRNEEIALTWPERAKALVIVDADGYALAGNMKKDLLVLRKGILEDSEEVVRTALAAHRAAVARRDRYLKPIEEAEAILKSSIRRFEDEQEAKRIAEQRRLEAEARVRERIDRERREAEAAAARAEAERIAAELRAKDEEARLAAAEEAQATGASEAAITEILDTPVIEVPEVAPVAAYMEPAPYTPPPVAAPTYDRMKGLGIRRTWGARVTSMKLLCKAVADGVIPETYVDANMTALNSRARSDKGAMRIPGVVAEEK